MLEFKKIKERQLESLMRLIEFAGSQTRLARELGVTPQVVHGWVRRGKISATMAIVADRRTKGIISKEDLRPDVHTWFDENCA